MKKKDRIEIVIEKCISLLQFQCDFYDLKPSEFIEFLDKVVFEIKMNLISDEKYEKLKEDEKNDKK